jgi:WD40 repeat protein
MAVASGESVAGVPVALAATVTGTAVQMASGQALTAGIVSARILSLVQGVPKAMFTTRAMIGMVLLIAAAVTGGGVAAVTYHRPATAAVELRHRAPVPKADKPEGRAAKTEKVTWKEEADFETPGWLPGSLAYSPNGKMLVVGGTGGHVRAIDPATRNEKWRAELAGDFSAVSAVAFAADGKSVLTTFRDGVRFLDADSGKPGIVLEQKRFHPRAVGMFPDREIGGAGNEKHQVHKVIFGNRQHYYVKNWIDSAAPGTISLATSAKDTNPADANAVPLAVAPDGRSVIVTGPIIQGNGKNVLWAWVAGDYDKGSPGNRLLEGHEAVVVCAAWSKDSKTAVTGDASGRLIVWDATKMKERHRLELGGRVAAVALSADGKRIAAVAIAGQAKYYVWETARREKTKPIFVDSSDFDGPVHGCLAFSPDGRQLAGSAMNADWLNRLGELTGKVHVWTVEKAKSGKEPEPGRKD